jgi:hypothetical protein
MCWSIRGRGSSNTPPTNRHRNLGERFIIAAASRKIVHSVGFETAGTRSELITPVALRFTSDRRTAFVALGRADHVAVIDYRKLHSQEASLGRPTRVAAWPLERTATDFMP